MPTFSAFTEGLQAYKTAAAWRAALGLGSGVPVPVAEGGTGATDAATARTNLGVPLAVQADQEAETAGKVVTSDVQQFHPSAAKCWASISGGGTPVLDASYNIASITDNGVGDLTITIATDFSSANWAGVATSKTGGTAAILRINPQAAGSVEIQCLNSSFALADPSVGYNFVGFGDQA